MSALAWPPTREWQAISHSSFQERAQLAVVAVTATRAELTVGVANLLVLLATTPCPVVLVSPRCRGEAEDGPVVCGVDGSPRSAHALRLAAELARGLGARLVAFGAAASPAEAARNVEASLSLAGTSAQVQTDAGDPARRLGAAASSQAARLIAIAARGRGWGRYAVVGKVALRLAVSAPVPLMVLPDSTFAGAWSSSC
jgi:nucleotide-binding universal stress UspA family protein